MRQKRRKKTKEPKKPARIVVGVRFLSNPGTVYHYEVPERARPVRGDMYIAENDRGTSVVVVVSVGRKPDEYDGPLKLITMKVVNL